MPESRAQRDIWVLKQTLIQSRSVGLSISDAVDASQPDINSGPQHSDCSCAANRVGARSKVAIKVQSGFHMHVQRRKTDKGRTMVMVHRSFVRRLASASVATLILAASAASTTTQEKKFKQVWVKTPDGLTISAQDWGNPTGPEIVFIHGFSQSHLSWIKQVTSDLAKDFHMVTYDLRGHGNSDKPLEPERYKDSKAWADELQAVMDATGIKRPVSPAGPTAGASWPTIYASTAPAS